MYKIVHLFSLDDGYTYQDRVLAKISTFFMKLLAAVQKNDDKAVDYLAQYAHEDKFTKLGYGEYGPGKGFGSDTFDSLVKAIRTSHAAQSGFINDILDAELYAENVGVDTISDLLGNLIHDVLSDYTVSLLNKLGKEEFLGSTKITYWNEATQEWNERNMPCL